MGIDALYPWANRWVESLPSRSTTSSGTGTSSGGPTCPARGNVGGPRGSWGGPLERALISQSEGKETLVTAAFDGVWDAVRGRTGPRQAGPRMPTPVLAVFSRVLLGWRPYLWITLFRRGPRAVLRETCRRVFTTAAVKR